ncbi:MAG TPA: aminoacyl-tRNA hydrolase [Pseudomonadales bacterium]|nr:aminoacyl-tRNA hydrolase [Pseudomonadales bacterium]
MSEKIQLIVGLGNPGREYEQTRHNAGAIFVAQLAADHRANWQEEKKNFGMTAQITIENQPVRLLLPLTYMNRSGQAIGAIASFYKIAPENILVAHDELDLQPGTARLKLGGGHGGHNGLRDIISALGNQNTFARLRIGIGHPGNAKMVADYVLKKAPAIEYNLMEDSITRALHVIPDVVTGNLEKAMLNLHSDKN